MNLFVSIHFTLYQKYSRVTKKLSIFLNKKGFIISSFTSSIKPLLSGVLLVTLFALLASTLAQLPLFQELGISALVIGIVLGMLFANTLHHHLPTHFHQGITFSAKKILRLGIVLYGFRITFQEIAHVGFDGFLVALTMLSSTLILGSWIGYRLFKMPKESAILTASGASVCGAAAVLATEPVLKAKEYQTAIAVSMVVLFGTLSMFLYPLMYESFIKDSIGFFHMSPRTFGIYVGGTIHEVAQVVAVPASVLDTPTQMANSAVIVKMTRVIMIAPMLILLGFYLTWSNKERHTQKRKLVIPWFALYFIMVAGFHSLHLLSLESVHLIHQIDTFLLTMAMTALGMGTVFSQFKGVGLAPLYTAGSMFVWLVVGGFIITKLIVGA